LSQTVIARPILEIASLSKTFPGQVALDDASLVVQPGQVHALVGQNGSGKSTLIKLLLATTSPTPARASGSSGATSSPTTRRRSASAST
jgi:ribose transport system ATP-binding protein